jgi:hypothetical protein
MDYVAFVISELKSNVPVRIFIVERTVEMCKFPLIFVTHISVSFAWL